MESVPNASSYKYNNLKVKLYQNHPTIFVYLIPFNLLNPLINDVTK